MPRARDYYSPDSGQWEEEFAIAPRYTPLWLQVELDAGSEEPVMGVQIQLPPFDELLDPMRGSGLSPIPLFSPEIVEKETEQWRAKLLGPATRTGYRLHRNVPHRDRAWPVILQATGIRHEGSPVGWYDLDNGFVRYATLWDLAHLKQGVPQDELLPEDSAMFLGRPLWLLSEKQWDNAEFPPPIKFGPPFAKGVTAAAEAGKVQEMRRRERREEHGEPPPGEIRFYKGEPVRVLGPGEDPYFTDPTQVEALSRTRDWYKGSVMTVPRAELKPRKRHHRKGRETPQDRKARDYPDMEAALRGAQSKHDATHATRGPNGVTVFSPTSRGYAKRTGYQEKGYFHWPERGITVDVLPSNAEMIHRLIDTGWDPEVAPERKPESMRRAAEEAISAPRPVHTRAIEYRGWRIVPDERPKLFWLYNRHGVQVSRSESVERAKSTIDRMNTRGAREDAEEVRDNPVDVADALPWVKVSRDPERYQEALKEAKAIGPIESAKNVYELLGPALMKEDQETFVVVLLDVRQQCRGVAEVHRGGRSRVSVSLIDVLRVVVASGAEGFVVVHNHPSGKASPSDADKDLTKSIERAAKIFDGDLTFVDHVICGNGEYYSFTDGKLHRAKKSKAA